MTSSIPQHITNSTLTESTGRTVTAMDGFEVADGESLLLTIEEFDDKRQHGVWIGTEGGVSLDGDDPTRWKVLWVSEPGEQHTITVEGTDGLLRVHNVWQSEHTYTHESLRPTSGMLVEVDGDTRRYRCEDHSWEPTFESIVFTLSPTG